MYLQKPTQLNKSYMKLTILFFGILLIFSKNILQAQTTYRFNNYSINEGLSQSSVTCIIQDNTNSLWVGTQDGLNRFDGKSFEIFNSDDTKGIESEYIRCSFKTEDGNLWFGTSNGLTKYDITTEKFKTYLTLKKTPLQIEKITVDENGKLWLASLTSGLIIFDTEKETFSLPSFSLPSKKILGVFVAQNKDVFLNTEDRGLFQFQHSIKQWKKIILPYYNQIKGSVLKITSIDPNKILLCSTIGVFEYSILTGEIKTKFNSLNKEYGTLGVTDIYLTKNNDWLIATGNNGLFTVKSNGTIFSSSEDIFQKNALINNKINVLFKDNYGTFWLGTNRGLSSFNPLNQGFLGIGPTGNLEHGIPTPSVWTFGEDKESKNLFIGTDKGISRYNRKLGVFEHFYIDRALSNLSVRETIILSLYVIDKNNVLVGSTNGFFNLKINSINDYSFTKIVLEKDNYLTNHSRVYSVLHWKDDQYFIGTNGGVVLLDLKTKKTKQFEHSEEEISITNGLCRLVYKDNNGTIWFATSTGGLNKLVKKGTELSIVPYIHNQQLLDVTKNYITSIYQRSKDEYWFGTFGTGLIKWNMSTLKSEVFNKVKGLPNNVIYGVLSTDNEKVWFSTNKGICCFNLDTYSTVNYKEVNGLMSNEFNMGSYFKSITGELYFGGINGYNFFNPKNLFYDQKEITVKFTKLKINKDWVTVGDKNSPLSASITNTKRIDLSYIQRSLTFHFLASDLSNPALVNYKYKIEGLDEEAFLGDNNELRLPSLSPGDYTLYVYARIGEGPWCKKPASIIISIASPFWWKWWFWLSISAIILLLVRLFFRQKIELERRKLVRLEMKIAERTREIRAKNAQIEAQNDIINKEKNKVIEQKRLLQIEKDKSENLIRRIIPESTVEELKNSGKTSARAYKMVSILFTDFVGFTKIAERMTPTELVSKLDVYFRKFDEIIVNNNLEKIKTIGDAYMCAGGVPVRNNTNPIDTCLAALQIQHYMLQLKEEAIEKGEEFWSLRLGINTGEVTAGVIGSERLAYDIWGSAVNRAQRMEMMGEPGKVTITGETYKLIEPFFECVFRGKAQSKSNNEIDMYSVERIKPQLSLDENGIFPNERFQQIVNLYLYSSINYNKAERYITRLLENKLSDKLHYHCIDHIQDVVNAVENLALTEDVTDEGLFLLKSAASYHDAGFIEQYDKNEPIGARLAEEILPKYGYTDEHIQIIKELIYVTQIPHKPKNKLEEIICDADLDYLGRDDFHEIADRLRRELREHGKIDSDRKWDEIQVQFLTNHRYFTKTAIATRRPKKLQNLEEIKERLLRNEYAD